MEYKDYYKTLGVSKSASDKEIRSAFRKLAQQYHPDKNPGSKQAEESFKDINEAYEVLGDPQKRARYDQLGASYSQWERAGRPGGGFDFSQWYSGGGGPRVDYRDLNDLFGQGGFSDFFNSLFGGAGARGARGARSGPAWSSRGDDVQQPVEISLEEAYHGAKRTLQRGDRRREVAIPKGARTGTRVRFAGEGGSGQPMGDLYLVVTVRPHPVYRREGDDLHMDLPVDVYTAVLGGEAQVPTLNGVVTLTIPPESQAGTTFRLAGKGMPRLRQPDEYGDLFVHAVVQIPTRLSPEERQRFGELAALRRRPE